MIDFILALTITELSSLVFSIAILIIALCEIVIIVLYSYHSFFLRKLLKQKIHDASDESFSNFLINHFSRYVSSMKSFFKRSSPDTILDAEMKKDFYLVDWERSIAVEYAKKRMMSNEELNNIRPDIAEEFLYNLDGNVNKNLDIYGTEQGDHKLDDATLEKLQSIINKASQQIISDTSAEIRNASTVVKKK